MTSSDGARLLPLLALNAALAFILFSFFHWGSVVRLHLASPTEMILEKPALTSARLMREHQSPYSAYAGIPYHVQMYTPAYPALLSLFPEGENPYLPARLVSVFFMLAAAGLLLVEALKRRTPWATLVSLTLFAFFGAGGPMLPHTAFGRQDPMALFLAAASIMLLLHGARSRWKLLLSALLAVLALTAKQSYIAAPFAATLFLFRTDRPALKTYAASLCAFGGAFALYAHLRWGADFWWSTVFVPAMSYRPSNVPWILGELASKSLLGLFAYCLAAQITIHLKEKNAPNLLLTWFTVTATFNFLQLAKEGSASNYFLEPALAGLLFLQHRLLRARFTRAWAAAALALPALLAIDLFRLAPEHFRFTSEEKNASQAAYLQALRLDLRLLNRQAPTPIASILVDPATTNEVTSLGYLANFSDLFLYFILDRDGHLDWRNGMLKDLQASRFDLVIVPRNSAGAVQGAFGPFFASELHKTYYLAHTGLHDYFLPSRRGKLSGGGGASAGGSSPCAPAACGAEP